jgi:hypothetical protein
MDAVAKRGAFRLVLENPATTRGALLSAAAAVYEARPYSVARQKADFSRLAESGHWDLLLEERPKNLQDLVKKLLKNEDWHEMSRVAQDFPLIRSAILDELRGRQNFGILDLWGAANIYPPDIRTPVDKHILRRLLFAALEFPCSTRDREEFSRIDAACMIAARLCEKYGLDALREWWDDETDALEDAGEPLERSLNDDQILIRKILVRACPGADSVIPRDNATHITKRETEEPAV